MKWLMICGLVLMSGFTSHAKEKLKVATVDMKLLFDEYVKELPMVPNLNRQMAELEKDNQRELDRIRELEARVKLFSDPELEPEKRREIEKLRRESRVSCKKMGDRRAWLARRNQAINEGIVSEMRKVLKAISNTIKNYALENDIDFIFDLSAKGKTHRNVLILSGDEEDITEVILKRLLAEVPAKKQAEK